MLMSLYAQEETVQKARPHISTGAKGERTAVTGGKAILNPKSPRARASAG